MKITKTDLGYVYLSHPMNASSKAFLDWSAKAGYLTCTSDIQLALWDAWKAGTESVQGIPKEEIKQDTPKQDWDLDTKIEMFDLLCATFNLDKSSYWDITTNKAPHHVEWFEQDLGKVMRFNDPRLLIEVFNLLVEKFGDKYLKMQIAEGWLWRNIEWRGKRIRAATFQREICIRDAKITLRDSIKRKPDILEGLCAKKHILTVIRDLFAVSKVFGLPVFSSYCWHREGFTISASTNRQAVELLSAFHKFLGDEAEKIELSEGGKSVVVTLKDID